MVIRAILVKEFKNCKQLNGRQEMELKELMEKKVKVSSIIGVVLWLTFIVGLATAGLIFIKSGGILIITLSGGVGVDLVAGLAMLQLRSQRTTRAKVLREEGSVFTPHYNHIPWQEQQLFHFLLAVTITMILVAIIWPIIYW